MYVVMRRRIDDILIRPAACYTLYRVRISNQRTSNVWKQRGTRTNAGAI